MDLVNFRETLAHQNNIDFTKEINQLIKTTENTLAVSKHFISSMKATLTLINSEVLARLSDKEFDLTYMEEAL